MLVRETNATAAMLALCIAAGYLVAALFPCDPGAPMWGSARQAIHNAGGAVEYVGGAVVLLRLGELHGIPFRAAGLVVAATAIALSIPALNAVRGLVQRIGEACLFGGLAAVVWLARTPGTA